MPDIICFHCLQKPSLPELKLESVKPLLAYLDALPQEGSDRALTWKEDTWACEKLLGLEIPDASRELDDLLLHYANPEYQKNRTLGVWYGIARSVARLIQDGGY